jgi:hypothetical protein
MSEEPQELNAEFLKKLDEIIAMTLDVGQLIVVACKGHGKTVATMWLTRRMLENKGNSKTIIFDTCLNWRYTFDKVPYVEHGSMPYLPTVPEIICDLKYVDSALTRMAISEIVMNDFVKMQSLKEQFEGKLPFLNIYVIEEMQNVLGSYSMNGQQGRFWLKEISEGRNFGQVFIGIGQRLADISTKVVERTRYYLFGAMTGDNDIRKVRRIAGKEVAEKLKTLNKGEFLLYDKKKRNIVTIIGFPMFKQKDKPYPYQNGEAKGFVKQVFVSD